MGFGYKTQQFLKQTSQARKVPKPNSCDIMIMLEEEPIHSGKRPQHHFYLKGPQGKLELGVQWVCLPLPTIPDWERKIKVCLWAMGTPNPSKKPKS